MKIHCKICGIELSDELKQLTDESLLNEADGQDFIPQGYYMWSDGGYFTNSTGKLTMNKENLINSKNHSNISRLNGCCGLDGLDGINKTCMNGHEIGTAKEDCWMPHCILIEPDLVITSDR